MRSLPRWLATTVLFSCVASSILLAASPPPASGLGGAVVSGEAEATAVGIRMLRAGGNAVDAAVATALALAVVHPQAGNLGGGGFALVYSRGEVVTLDFRESAPAAARRDMFLDERGRAIPGASLVGPLASGVPGSPAGLHELHRRFGKLPWRRVVEPARSLAAGGFRVSHRLHSALEATRERLEAFDESVAAWLPGGSPPPVGTRVRRPRLAATLEAYARQGAPGVTAGRVGAAIVAASDRHGGILTKEDLGGYRPRWLPALEFERFGWRFAAMDLPSSGGYLLAASLAVLELGGWRERPRFGADRAHLLAETWRLVFADRVDLGDRDSTRATSSALLQPARLALLAASIDESRAGRSESTRATPLPPESPETTHLSVIDADGMAVALTTTLNGLFGCGLWVPEGGFFLNNEMDDFTTAPGQPNLFGLIQGPANAIAPGRRMLSSMVPTVAWRDSELVAVGARGGSRIPTAVAQVLLNLLVDGDSLQEAVDRPRLHHQWLPDALSVEADALSPETAAALRERGHQVTIGDSMAKVNIARRLADMTFEAAGDPRGPAAAAVVCRSDRLDRRLEEEQRCTHAASP